MPKKVDHELRREEFLRAVYRTILRRGFNGITLRAVAREAGFTTGALVHYVESKDELLVAASEYSARDVRVRMEEVEKLTDPVEAVRQVLYLSLPSTEEMRGHWNFFLGFWERSLYSEAVREVTHARYTEWIDRLHRLISRARAERRVRSSVKPRQAARSAVALVDGIATQTLRSGTHVSAKMQRDLIDDWIRFWLQPTAGGEPMRFPAPSC